MKLRLVSITAILFFTWTSVVQSADTLPSSLESLVSQGELSRENAEKLWRLRQRLTQRKMPTEPHLLNQLYEELSNAEAIHQKLGVEGVGDFDPQRLISQLDQPSKKKLLEGFWKFLKDRHEDPALSTIFKSGRLEPYTLYSELDLTIPDRLALYESMTKNLKHARDAAPEAAVLEKAFYEVKAHPGKYPDAEKYFQNAELVAKMHFEKPAIDLAYWQLETAFPLAQWERESKLHPNLSSSLREKIGVLSQCITQRFGQALVDGKVHYTSAAKNRFIDLLEERIQTSMYENENQFRTSRHHIGMKQKDQSMYSSYRDKDYFPESYSPTASLRADDKNPFPRRVRIGDKEAIRDEFGSKATLEYLTGVKSEFPMPKDRMNRTRLHIRQELKEVTREEKANIARNLLIWKRELDEAPRDVRVSAISEMLGVAKPTQQEFKEILLGDDIDDKIYNAFFDAYWDAIPEKNRNFQMAKIFGASRGDGKGFSLKTLFEANGPGSVKFGQTLYSTRLAPAKEMAELKDLLDRSQKPARVEYMERLATLIESHKVDGISVHRYNFVESVGLPVGAGSVNYGIEVHLTHPKAGKSVRAVARFQREGIRRIVEEELAIYDGMFKTLLNHEDEEVRRAAAKAYEAWVGASKTLRGENALELSIDAERQAHGRAQKVYTRSRYKTRSGFRIEPVSPLKDFEKYLPDELKNTVAFYEYVPHTEWSKIKDLKLRTKLIQDIIDIETHAILNGHFDKDGHTGNWLVDLKNRRIVRVDYAQLKQVDPGELNDFVRSFKVHARPVRQAGDSKQTHELLSRIYQVDGIEAITPEQVHAWMQEQAYLQGKPHERFFHLRDRISDTLKKPVSLQSTANDALIAFSKIQGFEEYLDGDPLKAKKAFENAIGKRLYSWKEKLQIGMATCKPADLIRGLFAR